MADLHKVVYFGTVADLCGTELTPVNATTCANLNAVPNLNRTDLWDLDQALSIR
jgi:hypothetical protein